MANLMDCYECKTFQQCLYVAQYGYICKDCLWNKAETDSDFGTYKCAACDDYTAYYCESCAEQKYCSNCGDESSWLYCESCSSKECETCGTEVYEVYCDDHRVWCYHCGGDIANNRIFCEDHVHLAMEKYGESNPISPAGKSDVTIDDDGVMTVDDSEIIFNI